MFVVAHVWSIRKRMCKQLSFELSIEDVCHALKSAASREDVCHLTSTGGAQSHAVGKHIDTLYYRKLTLLNITVY